MNEEVIFGIGGMGFVLAILAMITIVAVVVISQVLKTSRAKTVSMAEIARDEAYRKLAEEGVALQRKIAADLAELRSRVESMENMLREVE
ncbi:hypothetical protein SPSYN_01972 [Sporotomaculum syntrophicum]|uniref:Uncharacterized protein n=1 Tax=Sporotomaculum syntrophicum TaxID=182264 RepID=A0A9D2WQL3_9FIRM|nr:hypothetical protein [Sporotomaculum syntrophicum]KAF1084802.1 hypothetical protein SPSYN_01972 [Sporotomaculum syntrophicum]